MVPQSEGRTLESRSIRRAIGVAFAVLAACVVVRVGVTGVHQLVAPFSLGPAEFSNLHTIQVIRRGENPYSPAVYATPPMVFSGYTPIFHALVALLPTERSSRLVGWVAVGSSSRSVPSRRLDLAEPIDLIAHGGRDPQPVAAFDGAP